MSGTSTKIISNGNVGMHNARNHGNNNSSSKDDSTIMHNPCIVQVQRLRMIVLSMKSSCFHDFWHCASLHHRSFDEMILYLYNNYDYNNLCDNPTTRFPIMKILCNS